MSERFKNNTENGIDTTLTRLIFILGAALCLLIIVCITQTQPLATFRPDLIFADTDNGISISYQQNSASESDTSLININTAGVDELMTLPGIGEKTADAIIRHREEIGFFRSIDDLLGVSGIGEKKLEAIRELIRID